MPDIWNGSLKLAIFGESHGPAIGMVVDGLPAGEEIDAGAIAAEMARRAPGGAPYATARTEPDAVELQSGLYNGRTTGAAVCGLIRNQNARSGDYNSLLRPGHADWPALLKYHGHADMRGGGHFSGRLTAALVFAGSLAKQLLARRGVGVYGRIQAIGPVRDDTVPLSRAQWQALAGGPFPACGDGPAAAMRQAILDAKAEGDSVGGVVQLAAFGVPGGLGSPFFHSLESAAAQLMFSIPAVKGVEFGDGFALAAMRGSQANDELQPAPGGGITSATNHNGGILGGITTGQPVLVRLAFKPTPSIALQQQTVDGATGLPAALQIRGRHDPCVVPRALPVAEAALALAILDAMLEGGLPPCKT